MVSIRMINEEDAEKLLALNKQLDQESNYMLFEPFERKTTIEQQGNIITTFRNSTNSTIIVAEHDNRLVGHLTVIGGNTNRIRHRAQIVIGILEEFNGTGIGTRLFNELEHWRINNHVNRLELTVMVHNERAIRLYKKMGFEIEGIKKNSLIVDGNCVDEYYMGKTY